jgi:hypothetical protein
MRTLTGAEATYQATAGAGNFGSLSELTGQGLIDSVLAAGNKSGYTFAVTETDVTTGPPPTPAKYISTATANVATGVTATGTRNFFSNEAGVITWAAASGGTMTASTTSTPIGQ